MEKVFSSGLVKICVLLGNGIYTIVDLGNNYSKYKGCNLITPNLLEASGIILDESRYYSSLS